MSSTLYYFHDPMCSWCWGYRPTWEALKELLPESVQVQYVLGGLAPDSDEPMSLEMAAQIQAIWHRIQNKLGTEFNFEFWQKCAPRRSTYPACRAVLAAESQNRSEEMILAIQEAYYLRAKNPSDEPVLVELANNIGLDQKQFQKDLHSPKTIDGLAEQIAMAREYHVPGFPSLMIKRNGQMQHLPIDYDSPHKTLELIL